MSDESQPRSKQHHAVGIGDAHASQAGHLVAHRLQRTVQAVARLLPEALLQPHVIDQGQQRDVDLAEKTAEGIGQHVAEVLRIQRDAVAVLDAADGQPGDLDAGHQQDEK